RHVVADGRGRHGHHRRDVARAHRLGGLDVLLHDGAEDGSLTFVEHARHEPAGDGSPTDSRPDDTDHPTAPAGPVRWIERAYRTLGRGGDAGDLESPVEQSASITEEAGLRESGVEAPVKPRAGQLLPDLVGQLAAAPSGVSFIASCLDRLTES